jgi:hypothetical protein
MADYVADIQKYTSSVNAADVKRVVDGFCAKKLKLDAKAARAAIMQVGDKMKEEQGKHRFPVYYPVAEHTRALSMLA